MTLIMRDRIVLALRIVLITGIEDTIRLLNKLILRYHRILYSLKNIWSFKTLCNTCGADQIYHLRILANKILIVGTWWSKRVNHCRPFRWTVKLYSIWVSKNRWPTRALKIISILPLI